MTDLVSKFHLLDATLNDEMPERRAEVWGANIALVAGSTYFMVGSWGVGKTLLPRRMRKYITGGEYFEAALSPFTMPERLFGPTSLEAFKEGRFEQVIDGSLATAHWAFLDEVFTATHVLDILLEALNERTFRHGTTLVALPLTTVFVAANSLPQSGHNGAFFDRLLLRFVVEDPHDLHNQAKIIGTRLPEHPTPILAWEDVTLAQSQARDVKVSLEVCDAAVEIREELISQLGARSSLRRLHRSLDLVRAAAWLDGCDEADSGHLHVLAHTLWENEAQIPQVREVVMKIADPLDNKTLELLSSVEVIGRDFVEAKAQKNMDDRIASCDQLAARVEQAVAAYKRLKRSAGKNQGRNLRLDEIRSKLWRLTYDVCIEFYETDGPAATAAADNKF